MGKPMMRVSLLGLWLTGYHGQLTHSGRLAEAPTIADENANPDEWGEFLHLPGEKLHDFDRIRAEIAKETEARPGQNAGMISSVPIRLRIFSPNVLTVTLVDLPGLTKAEIDIDLSWEITREYICKPSSIILPVTAVNAGRPNFDAVRLAREVDPEGKRTIGVVTKVDTM